MNISINIMILVQSSATKEQSDTFPVGPERVLGPRKSIRVCPR
jgi:hypothetical protein